MTSLLDAADGVVHVVLVQPVLVNLCHLARADVVLMGGEILARTIAQSPLTVTLDLDAACSLICIAHIIHITVIAPHGPSPPRKVIQLNGTSNTVANFSAIS